MRITNQIKLFEVTNLVMSKNITEKYLVIWIVVAAVVGGAIVSATSVDGQQDETRASISDEVDPRTSDEVDPRTVVPGLEMQDIDVDELSSPISKNGAPGEDGAPGAPGEDGAPGAPGADAPGAEEAADIVEELKD
jgi:hypothetical protein